jgi:hypothetical protein
MSEVAFKASLIIVFYNSFVCGNTTYILLLFINCILIDKFFLLFYVTRPTNAF